MSNEELAQVFDIRAVLESYAITEALSNISEKKIKYLCEITDAMIEAASRSDYLKQAELYRKFHSEIIRASKNKVLEKIWDEISIKYWSYIGPFI